MRRVRFSAAMSLDGYIAGPHGASDWIVMDPDIDFRRFLSEFDTLLLGRKTWEAAKGQGGTPMPGIRSIVVSRTLGAEDCPGVTLTADPAKAVGSDEEVLDVFRSVRDDIRTKVLSHLERYV